MAAQPSIRHTNLRTFQLALCIQCIIEISVPSILEVYLNFVYCACVHGKRTRQFARLRQWRHTPRVCLHLTATLWRSRAHIASGRKSAKLKEADGRQISCR